MEPFHFSEDVLTATPRGVSVRKDGGRVSTVDFNRGDDAVWTHTANWSDGEIRSAAAEALAAKTGLDRMAILRDLGRFERMLSPESQAEQGSSMRYRAPIAADELLKLDLPEPRYIVTGILPEGGAMLAGRPKTGKSWLALGMAVAVAAGGRALGGIPIDDGGDVLYLALEDTRQRLKKRLSLILAGDEAPQRLDFVTEWPRLDEGGAERIEEWLVLHPDARLVVVDTLARIRGGRARNGDAYSEDYQAVSTLKQIADRHGVALLMVHHVRKMDAEDPLDTISGTLGLTGALDTAMVLRRQRGRADAALFITGRDIEEKDLALSWDPEHGVWALIGDAEEYRMSKERADVLRALNSSTEPMTPTEIGDQLGKSPKGMKVLLFKMKKDGEVKSAGHGKYISGNPGNPVTQDHPHLRLVDDDEGNRVNEVTRVNGVNGVNAHTQKRPTNPCPVCDHADCWVQSPEGSGWVCGTFFPVGAS